MFTGLTLFFNSRDALWPTEVNKSTIFYATTHMPQLCIFVPNFWDTPHLDHTVTTSSKDIGHMITEHRSHVYQLLDFETNTQTTPLRPCTRYCPIILRLGKWWCTCTTQANFYDHLSWRVSSFLTSLIITIKAQSPIVQEDECLSMSIFYPSYSGYFQVL